VRFRSASLIAAALAWMWMGCATTSLVRPLGRGNTRLSGSTGGPIAVVGGKPIPVPLTTLGLAHGVRDDLDVQAEVHPFAALFSPGDGSIPILGMDLGAAWHPIPGARRALTLGASAYGFTNRLDALVFADLWIGAGAAPTPWFSFAGGFHNSFRLAATDPTLAERPIWAPTAFLQLAVRPFSGRVTIDLEGRWYAFTQNGTILVPSYVTIGDLGAIGVLVGVHFQWGAGAP
jgi:hypothetical protein